MLSPSFTRIVGGCLLVLLLALITGCGPDYKTRGIVKGKVTIKDKPLNAGTVAFFGAHNMTGTATIEPDGTYVVKDAPIGEVKITVTVPKPPMGGWGHLKDAPTGPTMPDKAPPISAGKLPTNVVTIPEKYSTADTSGLTFTVKTGEQTHDIPLTP